MAEKNKLQECKTLRSKEISIFICLRNAKSQIRKMSTIETQRIDLNHILVRDH